MARASFEGSVIRFSQLTDICGAPQGSENCFFRREASLYADRLGTLISHRNKCALFVFCFKILSLKGT